MNSLTNEDGESHNLTILSKNPAPDTSCSTNYTERQEIAYFNINAKNK